MNRKLISVLLLLVCSISALSAQDISIASFRLLENDLTANTHGTMEKDFNGEVSALIKVMTTEQGFVFDGGMVGIVKVRQEVSEIFVYVPHGIKKISIKHPQLGMIRDYYFPVPIEKARTYEMKLTTGRVETIVTRSAGKQYVMFNVTPPNAVVELDGMPLDVDSEGYAEKSMPYGTYDYRVSCANYHTEAGKLTVSSAGKVEKTISLRPNYGWIDFRGANDYHGAHVYVDGERIGQLPLKSDVLKSGTYRVKVLKPLYKPFEQQVTVTDNATTTLNVALVPNFANVTLTTDAESEIWIDGRQRGKGKCTIGLELGEYSVEVKRPSYRTVSDVITVSELADRTIQLSSPTPIYGVLDISSSPSRATVLVDGVEKGQTPLILNDVLVGSRKVTLKKEGYEPYEKTMVLTEDADNSLAAILEIENSKTKVTVSNASNMFVAQGVSGTFELTGRSISGDGLPMPINTAQDEGRVVVSITVNPQGRVIATSINLRTNTSNPELRRAAEEAAKNTEFNQIGANENQLGTITYYFKLKSVANGAKKIYTVNGVSFTMVDVEGGTFTMGATSEQGSDASNGEKPTHKVTLSNYSIGETEVTQALWQAVMGSNPSHFKGDLQRPVENVSWNDCQKFIKKLNKLTGKNFRLPTEAEWEYAARGGKQSKGYKYSGSNTIGDVAWYTDNSLSMTRAVKTKKPNELGVYDMSGNVYEWCSDWYSSSYYSSYSGTNPTGPSSGSFRVPRGGSWSSDARFCRVASRDRTSPDYRYFNYGFRLSLQFIP